MWVNETFSEIPSWIFMNKWFESQLPNVPNIVCVFVFVCNCFHFEISSFKIKFPIKLWWNARLPKVLLVLICYIVLNWTCAKVHDSADVQSQHLFINQLCWNVFEPKAFVNNSICSGFVFNFTKFRVFYFSCLPITWCDAYARQCNKKAHVIANK